MWKTAFAAVVVAVHFVIGIWFLTAFRGNLHCTQYTSFGIATFDISPHGEEVIDGPTPLVFSAPFAIPLRAYFAASLLAFVFWPSLGAVGVIRKRRSKRMWLIVLAGLTTLLLLNVAMPNVVSGERWAALNVIAIFIMLMPTTLVAVALPAAVETR